MSAPESATKWALRKWKRSMQNRVGMCMPRTYASIAWRDARSKTTESAAGQGLVSSRSDEGRREIGRCSPTHTHTLEVRCAAFVAVAIGAPVRVPKDGDDDSAAAWLAATKAAARRQAKAFCI